MKSNLLLNKIHLIQNEYRELLISLLPRLKSSNAIAALDELQLFWIRYSKVVQLYLKYWVSNEDSYVFTATTFLDFADNEHLPFLLIGHKHILDDPLGKYSELRMKTLDGKVADTMHEQIVITAEDNLKLLKNVGSKILILPVRLLSQSADYKFLYKLGEQAFVSLFNGVNSLEDYFVKCNSIDDIINFARDDIAELVVFSSDDDLDLSFEERFNLALADPQFGLDTSKSDGFNFFMLVFGCIQQAVDIIVSCVEYECIPYIRYNVSFYYVQLLLESLNIINRKQIDTLRFKMNIAHIVYRVFDKSRIVGVCLADFLQKKHIYNFNEKLFLALEKYNINESNFEPHKTYKVVGDVLEDFYNVLDN